MDSDQVRPLVVTLQPGRHAICACGRTASPPFCDGHHRDTEFTPRIEVVEGMARNVAWCRCFTSSNGPWCDGSHTALWTGTGPDPDDEATR